MKARPSASPAASAQAAVTSARGAASSAQAFFGARPYLAASAVAAAALAVSALVNHRLAKKAERDNPPTGRFLVVDGVRLHYVEQGEGEPLVLLHGNGSMIQDFETSGLVAMAATRYRVIAFDRPGYGHSERPRSTIWTPQAQARLIREALVQLDVRRATILGHSWGASVAMSLALDHPELVGGLVLASGYYYPTVRADVVMLSGPAIPGFGDVIRYTISPILSRLMWPLFLAKIFGPASVPAKFGGFPKEMAFRPSQIRASAAESALMVPNAWSEHDRYGELAMPVAIVAGEEDRLIDIDHQSARLHRDVPHSSFHHVRGVGHMVHQNATKVVMAAIDEVAGSEKPKTKARTLRKAA
ncbi:alpha/beta fold hydrolase [uncultured Enterovirga sp.]|uniref:alpha/beta fold hydrolase n=1 Tax=uncultured Enterovirga sp. TaxID=2026352 RepID=UPI0035CA9894